MPEHVWLSVGTHREDKSWKSKKLSWPELVTKLQKPRQTSETVKEYAALSKDQQGEKKDVGGFVGGVVNGGRRVKGSVTTRSILTLDLDYPRPGFLGSFSLFYKEAVAIYSTHSSTPEKPRYRIVMPLAKEVPADQYEAIARRVAGVFGINDFDDTTYQIERLMYWPSICKDAKYEFLAQDGPWLDPKAILATYRDWKDSSQWPVSKRQKEVQKRAIKEMEDPLTKPGIIGAFCNAYTITEAIDKFLPDIYDATDDEDRYTYLHGSTAKGLVIYDDKFAYSHHGTDPISGRGVNAFDLVRIHLFGGKDDDCDPKIPINKRPSQLAVEELMRGDKLVKRQLGAARLEKSKEAREVFSGDEIVPDVDEEEVLDLAEKLDNTKNGPAATIKNVYLICKHDPRLKGCFSHNSFSHRDIAIKNLPWRKIEREEDSLGDADDACLRSFMEEHYNIATPAKIYDGFTKLMVEKAHHPVRTYIQGQKWDGKKRIDHLLSWYFGVEETDYSRAIMRKTLAAAVARVFNPGCKFDYVLITVGGQGEGKSTFWSKLGRGWFSDTLGQIGKGKEAMETIQGKWIIEISELAAFRGQTAEAVKHFIAKREDYFRVSFGKRNEDFPRQCVFVGTTNNKEVLNDPTGDRRYWPVMIDPDQRTKSPHDMTDQEIGQIWAEAYQCYKAGEPMYLTKEMEQDIKEFKKQFREVDARDQRIEEYLKMPVPEEYYRWNMSERLEYISEPKIWSGEPIRKTTVIDIWAYALRGKSDGATNWQTKVIRDYFTQHSDEWENKQVRVNGCNLRGFGRKEKEWTIDDIIGEAKA